MEPQFRFERDDDDYNYADLSSSTRQSANGMTSANVITGARVTVLFDHDDAPKKLDDDESYAIDITADSSIASITSNSVWGAVYALDTFSQVVEAGNAIRHSPLHITDRPRYPWRGFLMDTANHFLSMDTIRTLVDGMASVKLNVLHWHIVDSYSFPFASEVFPQLARSGSWPSAACTHPKTHPKTPLSVKDSASATWQGTYTPADIREIVAYSRDRGIRVVPEMDVPGHAYSWGLSEELAELTVSCPRYTDELVR